jgi:GPN-loop GTPase
MLFGQIVIGPAGSGKSSYCHLLQGMARTLKRNVLVVNLDPAAEKFRYECTVDIRDLISVDDVMELTKLGPNGGLVYAMEYLIEQMDWFMEEIGALGDEDYVLFDCPGQLELYTHMDIMKRVINALKRNGFSLCTVCLVDSTFLVDESKFFSGVLMALSTMMSLELPHLTVLSKCDLVADKNNLSK